MYALLVLLSMTVLILIFINFKIRKKYDEREITFPVLEPYNGKTKGCSHIKMKSDYIISNINEGLILLDENKKIVSINHPAIEFLQGVDNFDYIGKNVIFLTRNHKVIQAIDTAYESGLTVKTIKIKDIYIKLHLNPVFENGVLMGLMCLVTDDTLSFTQEVNRRRFTANVSHELKTPLTAISGYADILCNMDVSSKDAKEFAKKIKKSADHMTTMINNIIKLSSLDENSGEFKKSILNLSQITKNVVTSQSLTAELKNVSIETNIQDSIDLYANDQLIYEMISNLMSNAIRYNYDGGTVSVTLENSKSGSKLTISDTGCGIPKKYLSMIFDRFFVVDKSRSKQNGGSGIGLSMVKHIAQTYGISIDLTSKEGIGTTFVLYFPRIDENSLR